ncbi:MAG: Rieske 2Fe-2S domain-containing protein [Rhodothermales bacterium]|nr:Rieske 2Fe-2S domain-containing protein [Rhodothermales bacterium]MBO6780501.1 Rieske 2Fe-2S domain-containing protein [Rhodothermales bacterium]
MGHAYQAVGWNRQKRIYDTVLLAGLALYLAAFVAGTFVLFPDATVETALIRAFGSAAFVLLHVVLIIGPLHRLFPGTAPLLYNRRHLGVTMFVMALAHAVLSTVQFHVLGPLNPVVSILTDGGGPVEGTVPFQAFGLLALVVLFLMAATSHDFWLSRLSAVTWKRLHQGVYVAYAALIAHVAFGILHQPNGSVWGGIVLAGLTLVGGTHIAAAVRDRRQRPASHAETDWIPVCAAVDIPDGRACSVEVAGESVAVFRSGRQVTALSGVCRHQGGPLWEGRVINGCAVCPWHGYEYDVQTGCAPDPFTERLPVFRVAVRKGHVYLDPTPLPPGTSVEPATIDG